MEHHQKLREEAFQEARSENALNNTLKRERQRLKLMDYQENYLTEVEINVRLILLMKFLENKKRENNWET